jgi:tetrahydromethanopterin S-methyltransferase subunit E
MSRIGYDINPDTLLQLVREFIETHAVIHDVIRKGELVEIALVTDIAGTTGVRLMKAEDVTGADDDFTCDEIIELTFDNQFVEF